jgi:hypothetical protein
MNSQLAVGSVLNCVEDVPQEVRDGARGANGRSDDLSFDHVPVADQTDSAVSSIFELNSSRMTGLHRNRVGRSFQSLNARHFIR